MEHDTSLWTSPYTDEKYGEEKGASWKYFQEFIKMDSPRTLVGFHKHLTNILTNNGRKRIPSYDIIREYSAKWKWFKRAEAYDNWKRDVDEEEDRERIRNIRRKAIAYCDDSFELSHQLDMELKKDMEMNTNQKIYGFAKNKEGFRNTAQAFNDLVNEGQTNINMDASLEAEIESTSEITVEDRKKRNEDYIRQFINGTENQDNG